MDIDRLYICFAFTWLLLGMVYGVYLGITDQLSLANSHAHANLLGFVLSALFGLMHRAWPEMRFSPVAWPQLAVYQIGVLVLVLGKVSIDVGGAGVLAPPGSLVTVLGTLMMLWLFLRTPAT